LLVKANVATSPILVTLLMEAPHSSETSVLTRSTRHNIPEDGIHHSHRRENFKSYIFYHQNAPNSWNNQCNDVSDEEYRQCFYVVL
jgi:hypothetical protein